MISTRSLKLNHVSKKGPWYQLASGRCLHGFTHRGASFVFTCHDDVIKLKRFPRVTGDRWTPAQRPVTRSFDIFYDLRSILSGCLCKGVWRHKITYLINFLVRRGKTWYLIMLNADSKHQSVTKKDNNICDTTPVCEITAIATPVFNAVEKLGKSACKVNFIYLFALWLLHR